MGILRSIPAWAGETRKLTGWLTCEGVYPRVGGGNVVTRNVGRSAMGLSPRGRGKPSLLSWYNTSWGSIPAWAGETSALLMAKPPSAVYPRVGGGNKFGVDFGGKGRGLSPRGRGKRRG